MHTLICRTMLYVIWTPLQSAQTTVNTCPPPHPSPQSNSQNHNVPSVPVISTKSYWSDNCPHLFTIKHSQNHYIPVVSTKSSWSGLHCIVVRPLSTLPTHSSCTHKMCNLIRKEEEEKKEKKKEGLEEQPRRTSIKLKETNGSVNNHINEWCELAYNGFVLLKITDLYDSLPFWSLLILL